MPKGPNEIINGFCYIDGQSINFVDILTERMTKYKRQSFEKFIEENNIDEYYIILSNYHDGLVTPLYKYSLSEKKSKKRIKANSNSKDELIDLFYKICIEMFPKEL
jgi:hypothetical protein